MARALGWMPTLRSTGISCPPKPSGRGTSSPERRLSSA
uniref:Uncharacterized protein n=1 Tax=Arundo donax TaxID=35708 RepID=A0A0A9CBR1_ARUDO